MHKNIETTNIIAEIEKWTGGPVPNLVWNGKWTTSWGKGNKFRFCGHPSQKWGIIYDWTTCDKQLFYVKGFEGKIEIPKPPEIKDISDEFNALQNATTHPYAKQKNITLPPGLKIKGNNLVVPLYSMDTHTIISWQEIFPQKDKDGKNKKFKANCPLTGGVYFMIGEKTKEVFACEGLATGVSINKITNKQVLCCFTIHSLDKLCTHLLSKKKYNKVVQAVDNDGPNTHKTKIKDPRFEVVCPSEEGDFNDHQDNIMEKFKLKSAVGYKLHKTRDEIKGKEIREELKNIRDAYWIETPKETILEPTFYSKKCIIPQNNAILVSGATGIGKTGFCLSVCEDRLKEGMIPVIWEHSEMNRFNRLNKWLEQIKTKYKPIFTPSKREFLKYIIKNGPYLLYTDDTDSFFEIQKPTDRREVGDTLEDINYICPLVKKTWMLCHYQTKISKTETDIQNRSGGSMTWINKMRYAIIIEPSNQQVILTDDNGKKTQETIKKPYIAIQKGYRPKSKISSWWLDKNFRPDEAIKDSTFQKILKKKTNQALDDSVKFVNKTIFEYHEENGELKTTKFYTMMKVKMGLAEWQLRNLLNYSNYKSIKAGYGTSEKPYFIIVHKSQTAVKAENNNKLPEIPF